ncbi:MAG TPA: hypothetical protein PLV68_11650 [Ilumatobacteraceae bacterium]|nr:hypothetical protein [Ilumatobacteraceae bacterium]
MSAWAGIESDNDSTAASGRPPATVAATPVPRTARLRRATQPLLESFDTAGVMFQRWARPLLIGTAVIMVPTAAVQVIGAAMAFDRYADFSGAPVALPLWGDGAASRGVEDVVRFVGLVTASMAAALTGGFVAPLVARYRYGMAVRVGDGLRPMVRRLPALVVAWALGHCWIVLAGWVAGSLEGSTRWMVAVFVAPVLAWIVAVTLTVVPVMMLEARGPLAGLRRAAQLYRRAPGMAFGFVVLGAPLGAFLHYGLAVLPRLLQEVGLITFGRFGWLVEGVAAQIGLLISAPVLAVATTLCYLEMRMQAEGMDLIAEADHVFPARR